MLVHLNDTKSLIIISVQDSFDTGGFTCTCITEQQTVVGFFASDKGFCVLDEFLFRDLISYQVFQFHMCDPGDRLDHDVIILIMTYTECFVKSQLAYTEVFIELYHICHKFFCCPGFCQSFAHLADTVSDAGIKHLTVASCVCVITKNSAAGNAESLVQYTQVEIIQFLEYTEII